MGAHTFVSSLVHCVFSTKGRRKLIPSEMQTRLWPYLGGIARQNGFTAVAIGGIEDHVHMLLALPATMAISKALQLVKGGSSKWIHDTLTKDFEWRANITRSLRDVALRSWMRIPRPTEARHS